MKFNKQSMMRLVFSGFFLFLISTQPFAGSSYPTWRVDLMQIEGTRIMICVNPISGISCTSSDYWFCLGYLADANISYKVAVVSQAMMVNGGKVQFSETCSQNSNVALSTIVIARNN